MPKNKTFEEVGKELKHGEFMTNGAVRIYLTIDAYLVDADGEDLSFDRDWLFDEWEIKKDGKE